MGAVQSAAADGEALDAHGHVSEDVLHAGAHAAAHLVPQALALGERLVAPRLLHGLQADLHLTHGRMVVGRAVGAVGQVLLPGVAVLGQVGQGLAVVHVGWAHHEVVDQLAVAVHLHVVLVAEVVLAVLAAPARVDVLLPGLAGAPAAWGPAFSTTGRNASQSIMRPRRGNRSLSALSLANTSCSSNRPLCGWCSWPQIDRMHPALSRSHSRKLLTGY